MFGEKNTILIFYNFTFRHCPEIDHFSFLYTHSIIKFLLQSCLYDGTDYARSLI